MAVGGGGLGHRISETSAELHLVSVESITLGQRDTAYVAKGRRVSRRVGTVNRSSYFSHIVR